MDNLEAHLNSLQITSTLPSTKKIGPAVPPKPKKHLSSLNNGGAAYPMPPPPPPLQLDPALYRQPVYKNSAKPDGPTLYGNAVNQKLIYENLNESPLPQSGIIEAVPVFYNPDDGQLSVNAYSLHHPAKRNQSHKMPEEILYSNVMHSAKVAAAGAQPPLAVKSNKDQDPYCNLAYGNNQEIENMSLPHSYGVANEFNRISCEDDLPQPSSPVSSSYSELRRTMGNAGYPPAPVHPAPALLHHQPHTMTTEPQIYANSYHPDFSTYGISSADQSYGSDDYYGYETSSQNSSTYESIYEPINPRPSSQMSSQSNYSLYPYMSSSQSGSQMGGISGNGSSNARIKQSNPREAEVDALTNLLVQSIDPSQDPDSYGICVKCGERVIGENSGCTAMDQIYHIGCFTCCQCQINLQGKSFFALEGKPFCEDDYLNTLEKCSVCMKSILERIIRATGKPYHPECFCCVVCSKSLDGIPFTIDATNQIHCIEDFHKKFAPRCCVCREPIMPETGQEETVRVVALDRSFHVSCYKCEDCGLLLSSEAEGRGCYPLDDFLLCKSCNAKRVQALTSHMTTEL